MPVFPIVADAGWLYLNLNTFTGSPADPVAQAWVTTVIAAEDRYGLGLDAMALDSACDPSTIILGPP